METQELHSAFRLPVELLLLLIEPSLELPIERAVGRERRFENLTIGGIGLQLFGPSWAGAQVLAADGCQDQIRHAAYPPCLDLLSVCGSSLGRRRKVAEPSGSR